MVTATPGGASATVDGTRTSAVVQGLKDGATYTFTVVAINTAGSSSPSSPSQPITLPGSPNAFDLVGLGDSFTSGEGNPPFTQDSQADTCDRSTVAAYVDIAAKGLAVSDHNYACSGASPANMLTTSDDGEPPQITNLTGGERYIALTAGGDGLPDGLTFGQIIRRCVNFAPLYHPTPCAPALSAQVSDDLQQTPKVLVNLYQQLQHASPNADIYVLNYPALFAPTTEGCQHIRADDVAWLRQTEPQLNAAIAQAITTTDADPTMHIHLVDVSHAFDGHELCTGHSWFNEINWITFVQSDAVFFFHPGQSGQQTMADYLVSAIVGTPPPFPGPAGIEPAITSSSTVVVPGGPYSISAQGFAPSSTVLATMDPDSSTPTTLGTTTSDGNGIIQMTLQMPPATSAGNHIVELSGLTANGDAIA